MEPSHECLRGELDQSIKDLEAKICNLLDNRLGIDDQLTKELELLTLAERVKLVLLQNED